MESGAGGEDCQIKVCGKGGKSRYRDREMAGLGFFL